jgi:hypothetical protein
LEIVLVCLKNSENNVIRIKIEMWKKEIMKELKKYKSNRGKHL